MAELGGVAHRVRAVDFVAVPPADAGCAHVPGFNQLGEDPLRCAFGDPDPGRDVAKTDVRVLREAEKDLGVVRQERPTPFAFFRT